MRPTAHRARTVRLLALLRPLILLTPAVCSSATDDVRFSDPRSPTGVDTERGIVVVRCKAHRPDRVLLSRGALVDTGADAPTGDVVLTAAHGMPPTTDAIRRDCSIEGHQGRSYEVEHVWRGGSASTKQGVLEDPKTHDWAVLLTSRRLGSNALRLRYAHVEPEAWSQLISNEAPVQLLLRRAEAEKATCRLSRTWLTSAQVAVGLFTHSCRSWEGHSGSPIVIGMDGELAVIGLQLARTYRPFGAHGPPRLGIGRRIDATIGDALNEAARTLEKRR